MKNVVKLFAVAALAVSAHLPVVSALAESKADITPPNPNVMRTEANSPVIKEVRLETQFVVCGGGLSGICAAISAARRGVKVVLVQDRPVLGGNASSEMRMGIMGAAGDHNKEAGILEKTFFFCPRICRQPTFCTIKTTINRLFKIDFYSFFIVIINNF